MYFRKNYGVKYFAKTLIKNNAFNKPKMSLQLEDYKVKLPFLDFFA